MKTVSIHAKEQAAILDRPQSDPGQRSPVGPASQLPRCPRCHGPLVVMIGVKGRPVWQCKCNGGR